MGNISSFDPFNSARNPTSIKFQGMTGDGNENKIPDKKFLVSIC